MASEDRLELIAPELSRKLRGATVEQQRAAALAATQFALSRNGLIHPVLQEGIRALREGRYGEEWVQGLLQRLVETLDQKYFELQDAADAGLATEEEFLNAFRKARTANAFLFALKSDSFEAATESAYEANAATEDLDSLRVAILHALV